MPIIFMKFAISNKLPNLAQYIPMMNFLKNMTKIIQTWINLLAQTDQTDAETK